MARERAGHKPPALAAVNHNGLHSQAEIDWTAGSRRALGVNDPNVVTEHGAEAVTLAYVQRQFKLDREERSTGANTRTFF